MAAIPEEWVQVKDESPYLIIQFGAILTALIGAPLAALGISFTNLPLGFARALSGLAAAAGEAVATFWRTLTGMFAQIVLAAGGATSLSIREAQMFSFLLAIIVTGLTLYGVSLVIQFALGGGE